MRRGEIYYADLNPVVGSEQGGCRPVLIVSNDIGNKHSMTAIVACITSERKNGLPTHVSLQSGMKYDSTVMLEQIRTIDKSRIGRFVCKASDETMNKVEEALKISFGIERRQSEEVKSKNELVFKNDEFGEIRTELYNDQPMFCLSDICRALGLTQPSKVKERLSEKGVRSIPTLTNGGVQNLLYIDESNLYKTIFQSRKESAEKFTEWVTEDVLPSIRKTGSYQMRPMSLEEMMRVQLGMIDKQEERISKLENTMNINYGQQRVLEKEVAAIVIAALGGKNSNAYHEISKKVFSECNRDVKDYFDVNSRSNIPQIRFNDAVEYIKNWTPCSNTRMKIKELNAQVDMG